MVSVMRAEKLIGKGCNAYLTYVMGLPSKTIGVREICTVKDYPDVFLNELPGLLLDCEVEFTIELYPSSLPVSITPYRITPKKFKELKIHLQELLDRGSI